MEKRMTFKRDEGRKLNVVSTSCSPVLRNYAKIKAWENLGKRNNEVNEIPKILIVSPITDQANVKSDREYRPEEKLKPQISKKSANSNSKSPYNSENNKLPKVRIRRISEFHEKFEKKWIGCRGLTGSEKFQACVDLLDGIIQEDFLFGSYLMRIKNDLQGWKKNFDVEGEKKCLSPGFGAVRQSVNVKRVASRKKLSIKVLPNSRKNLNITIQDDVYVRSSLIPEFKPKNCDQIEINLNKEVEDSLKALQEENEILKAKQLKYDQLINALNNRGYPIDEIYENDVLNQSPLPQTEYILISPLLKDLNLSSDDSFS